MWKPSIEAPQAAAPGSDPERTHDLQLELVTEAAQENWGRTQQMWKMAPQQAMASLLDNRPNAAKTLLREYGGFGPVAMDPPFFKQQCGDLANEISANVSAPPAR